MTAKDNRADAAEPCRRIVQGGRSTFYCPQVPALTSRALFGRGRAASVRACWPRRFSLS